MTVRLYMLVMIGDMREVVKNISMLQSSGWIF